MDFQEFKENYSNCTFDVDKNGNVKIIPPVLFRPKEDDAFYFIDEYGQSDYACWDECSESTSKLQIGNVFATEEKAEEAINRLKAIRIMREHGARPFIKGKINIELVWSNKEKCLYHGESKHDNYIPLGLYFDSSFKASDCIVALEKAGLDRVFLNN